jgi:hypothetical protein
MVAQMSGGTCVGGTNGKKIEAIQNIFDMGLQLIVLASFQYNSNTTVISIIILP